MLKLRYGLIALLFATPAFAQNIESLPGYSATGTPPTGFQGQNLRGDCTTATPTSGVCWPVVELYNQSGILSATNGLFITPTTSAGMATSANQSTEITSLGTIAGNSVVNGSTASTTSTQMGGTVVNGPYNPATLTPHTNGTQYPFTIDGDGNLHVEETNWASLGGSLSMASVTPTFASSGSTISGLTAATFTAGSAVVFADSGGSLPAGVSAGTPYLIVTSSSTVATISTVSGVAVTWSGAGTGTQTAVQAYVIPITDGMTTEAVNITLSGGGAVTPLVSPDGVNWTGTNYVGVVSGTLSNTFGASNTAKFAIAGWQYQAFYASTPASAQTFAVDWDQSAGGSTVSLTSPLPNGGNTIGSVNLGTIGTAATAANQIPADGCTNKAKLGAAINLTASGQIITGTAAEKTYICSINILSATTQSAALVEGTGTVCATNIFGLAGGTTAATGWPLPANGGLTQGGGNGTVISPSADTNATAANVCLLLSSTGQVSGHVTYVQQ